MCLTDLARHDETIVYMGPQCSRRAETQMNHVWKVLSFYVCRDSKEITASHAFTFKKAVLILLLLLFFVIALLSHSENFERAATCHTE